MKSILFSNIILCMCLFSPTFYGYILKQNRVMNSQCFTASNIINNTPIEITAKSITNEIMGYFQRDVRNVDIETKFRSRLQDRDIIKHLDGMHILTILFQCARSKKLAKNLLPLDLMIDKLSTWGKEWSERDISTFVYGVRSLEGIDPSESKLLQLGAKKIKESNASLSSRSIGNSLYGLQAITSTTIGIPELCEALATKITQFDGDFIGQDIGIGVYGLQGLSSDNAQVRLLVGAFAQKIASSVSELDSQAISNALYGLQSLSSDYSETNQLVNALASKISESSQKLSGQALSSALYGFQKLSSDKLEVRTLVAVIAEKVVSSSEGLDAQAVGNSLFGLQRMKTSSAEVRALVQAIAEKIEKLDVELDSKAIGASLYGLHSMNSDVPQVQFLLKVLATKIEKSQTFLSGQGIADALYGLSGMQTDCPELRKLISTLTNKIDSNRGKLDSQEIGNAIYGFSGLSSDMIEVRQLAVKIGEKLRRSTAILRSQHIGRALLGLQKLRADSVEIRYLVKQLTKRIAASDRTRMTSVDMADAVFGLQGMNSKVPEVQELVGEIAKKIASTSAEFSPVQLGQALFGLQGLSSSSSIFQDSTLGLDSDEVTFLLSAIYDKIKMLKEPRIPLSSLAMALQGLPSLKDPISMNIKTFLYNQIIKMDDANFLYQCQENLNVVVTRVYDPTARVYKVESPIKKTHDDIKLDPLDVVNTYKSIKLNYLEVPAWLEKRYKVIEQGPPVVPFNRLEKLVSQRYSVLHNELVGKYTLNSLYDGFRMDFKFDDLSLNIELDGPTHSRFDTLRDEYLKVLKNFEIVRIKAEGKSVDDIVNEINKIVKDYAEKLQDNEIQKLYMKEDKIQKLYSPKRK